MQIYTRPIDVVNVNVANVAYAFEDLIALNFINFESNKYDIAVTLTQGNNVLINNKLIHAGDSIGNFKCDTVNQLAEGQYPCKLEISVVDTLIPISRTKDITLIIK